MQQKKPVVQDYYNTAQSPLSKLRLGKLWQWLTEPDASIQDAEERHKAQYIAAMLVVILLAVVPFGLILARMDPIQGDIENRQVILTALSGLLFVASYRLSRTSHYHTATLVAVISGTMSILALFLIRADSFEADYSFLIFLVPPTLAVSIVMSRRASALFMIFCSLALLVLPQIVNLEIPWSSQRLVPFIAYVITSATILLYIYHRNQLEAERLAVLYSRDTSLRAYALLEQRIAERTHELSQANQKLRDQIQEREQAEAALAKERTLLRTIIDSIPDMIYVKNLDERIIVSNEAHRQYLDAASFKDVIGKTNADLLPPETAARFQADDQRVIQSGQPFYEEHISTTREGDSRWFATFKVPLRSATNEIAGLVGISRDMTERKQWETALQQAHDKLEARVEARTAELQQQSRLLDAILANTPDHFYVIDEEGRFLYVSPGATQSLTGIKLLETNELVGATWGAVNTLSHTVSSFEAAREDLFQHGKVVTGEWSLKTPAGRRYYEYTFSPLRDDQGQITSAVCTVHHITERKQTALSLEQSRAELQAKTESLTVINTIADSIYRSLDVQTIIEKSLDSIVAYTHVPAAAILSLDEARQVLEIMSPRGFAPDTLRVGSVLPVEGSLSGIAVKRREIVISTELLQDDRAVPVVLEQLEKQDLTFAVIVPLLFQEKVVGTLNLIFDKPHDLPPSERETLLAIGNTIALAVTNARYVEQIKAEIQVRERAEYAERRQRILAQTLASTASVINSTLELDQVLDAIMASIESVIAYDTCNIMLIKDGVAQIVRGRGFEDYGIEADIIGLRFTIKDTPNLRDMAATREPYLIGDTRTHPEWIVIELVEWVASYLGVPIEIDDEVIGILNMDSAEAHAFTQADTRIIQAFADQAAIAIRNARLYHATRRRQQYLATLRRVSRRSVPERDPANFMRAVVQALVDEFHYAGAVIMLGDDEQREMRVGALVYGFDRAQDVDYSGYRQSYDAGIYGWVMRHGQPRLIQDTSFDEDYLEVDFAYGSQVAVPIRQYGKTIGLLAVSRVEKYGFDELDLEAMIELAEELALSLDNVRLNEKTEQYAGELEKRVAERTAEVETERAQLHTILNSMKEGVAGIIFGDPPVRYVNTALCTMLDSATLDWNSAVLWQGESEEYIQRVYETVIQGGIWQGERYIQRDDGHSFDAAVTMMRIGSSPSNALGLVMMVRDISQEKELDKKKARFVANASHELRTPITNLMTRLYLMRRQPDQNEEHFQILERVATRMKQLVEDMLEFTRFEHGVIPVIVQESDLRLLVTDVVELQQAEAVRQNITLMLEIPENPVIAAIDSGRMNQVVTNLVVNAIHYTPDGGQIRVRLETESDADQGPMAVIRVRDTGIGIAPENLELIFTPFFRVQGISGGGSGLGLSISKEIVERHGGTLTVESQAKEGSCFVIRIPLKNSRPLTDD